MKEIIYDGQACRQGTRNVPTVTFNSKSGRIAVSKDAAALFGNPSSVVVIRDAEHPADWFIRPAKVGYVFNVYEARKSTSRVFFDRRLAGDVIASFAVPETSIRMGLAMEPGRRGPLRTAVLEIRRQGRCAMKAIVYTLTAVSALLTVTALAAVLCGVPHQLAIVLIGGLITYMGALSIREEESDGR